MLYEYKYIYSKTRTKVIKGRVCPSEDRWLPMPGLHASKHAGIIAVLISVIVIRILMRPRFISQAITR